VKRKSINYENRIQKRIRKAKELKHSKRTEKDTTSENAFNSSQEVAWGLHLADQIPRELRKKSQNKNHTPPTPQTTTDSG